MPVKCVKRGDTHRVVEAETGRIAKSKNGEARDGGGHKSPEKCKKQARAINASLNRS